MIKQETLLRIISLLSALGTLYALYHNRWDMAAFFTLNQLMYDYWADKAYIKSIVEIKKEEPTDTNS